jgi:hypothetical protein
VRTIGQSSILNDTTEKISIRIHDLDPKGENKGTEYFCTASFYFKVTDTREDVIKKLIEGFDIVQSNLKYL